VIGVVTSATSRVISQKAALAHSLNATEGTYRRMKAVERRRQVMTRYADRLNDESGKVLAFPIGLHFCRGSR
jgi:hypothetical protein